MDNISALSLNITAAHGRDGPGTWEQNEGFVDFMQALLSRGDKPAPRAGLKQNAETYAGMWMTSRIGTTAAANTESTSGTVNTIDMDVESVVIPPVANGQEDLMQLIALLLGEEENDDFCRSLEQYIAKVSSLSSALETLQTDENSAKTDKLLNLIDLLPQVLKQESEEELPPELAPLMALLTPVTPPIDNAVSQNETAVTETAQVIGNEAPVEFENTEIPLLTSAEPVASEVTSMPAVPAEQTAPAEQTDTAKDAPVFTIPVPEQQAQMEQTAAAKTATDPITAVTVVETTVVAGQMEEPARVTVSKHTPRASYANHFPALRTVRLTDKTLWEAVVSRTTAVDSLEAPPVVIDLAEAETAEVTVPKTDAAASLVEIAVPEEKIAVPDAETTVSEIKTAVPDAEIKIAEKQVAAAAQTETEIKPAEAQKGKAALPAEELVQSTQQPQATQQATQTSDAVPARQVLADKIIDQIMTQVTQTQDATVLHMELNPKLLGKIQLVLEAGADGITARIKSDNEAVRSLLGENITELRNALKDAGINMKDISVTETRVRADLSGERHENPQAQQSRDSIKPIRMGALSAEPEWTETSIPLYATGRVSGGEAQFDYRV